MVEVTVWNKNDFLGALEKEGYGINLTREMFGDHQGDSARERTEGYNHPAMHFANDDPRRPTTFWAHVDEKSAYTKTSFLRYWYSAWHAGAWHKRYGKL